MATQVARKHWAATDVRRPPGGHERRRPVLTPTPCSWIHDAQLSNTHTADFHVKHAWCGTRNLVLPPWCLSLPVSWSCTPESQQKVDHKKQERPPRHTALGEFHLSTCGPVNSCTSGETSQKQSPTLPPATPEKRWSRTEGLVPDPPVSSTRRVSPGVHVKLPVSQLHACAGVTAKSAATSTPGRLGTSSTRTQHKPLPSKSLPNSKNFKRVKQFGQLGLLEQPHRCQCCTQHHLPAPRRL